MAATSVTGQGIGMAAGQKGPGNNRNYFVPESTPHCVASGNASIPASVTQYVNIVFPETLPGVIADYAILATGSTGVVYVTLPTVNGFRINGALSDDVAWMVLTTGYGLEVTAVV